MGLVNGPLSYLDHYETNVLLFLDWFIYRRLKCDQKLDMLFKALGLLHGRREFVRLYVGFITSYLLQTFDLNWMAF